MNEPPILPADDSFPGRSDLRPAENPYAPGHIEPLGLAATDLPRLPTQYWAALAFVFPVVIAFCIYLPGIGIPALIALVSAVIRVPLMRGRPRPAPAAALPQPLLLLLSSWIFCLLIGVAASSAFLVICFPLGLMAFSLNGEGIAVPMVFGFSGVIALVVYVYLFRLSLRMSL